MARIVLTVAALAVSTASVVGLGSPSSATSPATWSTGQFAVFGDGVVWGGDDDFTEVSEFNDVACATPGNCTAVGYFLNPGGFYDAFTMTSTDGVWGQAIPAVFANGLRSTDPDQGADAVFSAVACAEAGNCTAVGYFSNVDGVREGFTMTSDDGVWNDAIPTTIADGVPLHWAPQHDLDHVTCTSPGNCTASGTLRLLSGVSVYTVRSIDGTWEPGDPMTLAVEQPDNVNLRRSNIRALSCPSAEICVAGGTYTYNTSYGSAVFTATSTNGVWHPATAAAFPAEIHRSDGGSFFTDLSCASANRCTAVGSFETTAPRDGGYYYAPYAMTYSDGEWGPATPLTFADGVNPYSQYLVSVDCPTTLACAVIGSVYTEGVGYETYVVEMVDGVWQPAELIAFPDGVRSPNPSDSPGEISCPSAGNCTAVGEFLDPYDRRKAFTVNQLDGIWGQAQSMSLPDPYPLQRVNMYGVDCPAVGTCTAVGSTENEDGRYEAMTVMSLGVSANTPTTTVPTAAVLPPALPALVNIPVATSTTDVVAPTSAAPTDTVPASTEPTTTTTLPAPALSVVRELPAAPTPIVADPSFTLGGQVVVTFGGFTPFEYVQLIVASTPQVIASGYADAQGVVTLSGNLPADLTSGTHTVAVYAPQSGVGFSQPIQVTAPQLPATGSDALISLYLAAIALVTLGLAVARPRRRVT